MNTTAQNLVLSNGAISKLILSKAGQKIQAECQRLAPNGVGFGNIVETPGYKLPCAKVYHGACKGWDDGAGPCETVSSLHSTFGIVYTFSFYQRSSIASYARAGIATADMSVRLSVTLWYSSSFIVKTHEMSNSIQIKAGTTRQKTALTVALGIHINTSIKHYSSKAKHTIYEKH